MWPLIEPILIWKGETNVKPGTPTLTTTCVLSGNWVNDTLTEGSNTTNILDVPIAPNPP